MPCSWQERNFTRAAAAMHLSQPAFSALIGGLEETLGVRLFDRSTRHVALTVEGAEFEGPARRVLAEFDSAVAGMHDRGALRRGRVSLALLPSLAAGWLPAVLAALPRAPSGHRGRGRRRALGALHRAGEHDAGRLRPRRRARRDARAAGAGCSAPTTSTSSAAPTIRWRSARADPAARPRGLALHPPVADQQRAPVPRRGLPAAGDGHGAWRSTSSRR